MVDIETAIHIVRAFAREINNGVPSSVFLNLERVPQYDSDNGAPSICSTARQDAGIGRTCRAHYKSLAEGEGEVTCPFGISHHYFHTKLSNNSLYLSAFTGFDRNRHDATVQDFPRTLKKLAKEKCEASSDFLYSAQKGEAVFSILKNALTTLMLGRVAEGIRAYSHALLTPIHGAINDVETLYRRLSAKPGDIEDETVNRLKVNLRVATNFAASIKLLLSEQSDFLENKLTPVTVHSVVHEIVSILEGDANKKTVRIRNTFNRGTLKVDATPSQIYLAFFNMIQNGVKYSFDGFAEAPREVVIRYRDDGPYLVTSVVNEGCRITEDEIAERKIFQLGYRGLDSGDRGREGSGTGLYIAEKIVSAHGGRIEVKSEPVGVPTTPDSQRYRNTFEVWWPVIHEPDRA